MTHARWLPGSCMHGAGYRYHLQYGTLTNKINAKLIVYYPGSDTKVLYIMHDYPFRNRSSKIDLCFVKLAS
jgi:hypothetical protein